MPLYAGSRPITAVYAGSRPITAIYQGSRLLWTAADMADYFDRDDVIGLGPDWSAATGTADPYLAAVVNGYVRMNIPNGLISQSLKVARHRYIKSIRVQDDGYIETRVATKGDNDGSLYTQVFDQLSDTAFTDGVGIELRASGLYITRRSAGVDTRVTNCGAYLEGDVIRLAHIGRNYTMTRNGAFVGEFDDAGATVQQGLGYQSMGLAVSGIKGFLGPRHFSAGLDYIVCG